MERDAMVDAMGRIEDVLRDFIERMAEGIESHSENSSEEESETHSENSSEEKSETHSENSSEEKSEPDSEDSSEEEEEFEPLLGEYIKIGANDCDYAIIIEYKGHAEAIVYNLPEKDEDDEKDTLRVETMLKPPGDTGASIGPGTSEPLLPQLCKGRKLEIEIKVVETPFSQYIGGLEGLEEAILEEYQRRLSSETPKYFFTSEHKRDYKNKLKKIEQFINVFQAVDETKDYIELKSKVDSVKDILKELDNLQKEYSALPDKVVFKNALDILIDMEKDAEKFKVSILELLSKYEEQEKETAKLASNSHIKSSELPLPTFSGKFQEFKNFKTKFMSVIGNNDSLNVSQKLVYLKSALKNDVALMQNDQDNFDFILKALENRYENKRALVDIHIVEILSINKLHNENPTQIKSLIDNVRNRMRSLKNLKLESNSFSDAIILHVLNNKIDKKSQRLFQLSLTTAQVPSLQGFLSFLDLRCIQLESVIKSDFAAKNESQGDLLRIVWKESIHDSIKTYKMNRVVYGPTCDPYLAQRVFKELVMDDGHNYPLAASAVSSDDLISGAADIYSAK
ncbi:hypothetical protein AVEN_157089-1 [Araneus ventricosus]|uniref:Uncharacterized protein n=1 Tax=Araneus ventricosus TaxID=182803 RepID=A0A4Y2FUN4_ARAVE|nr:hypothetical protein AVEN_157089-1 [Araneus ventricosus]